MRAEHREAGLCRSPVNARQGLTHLGAPQTSGTSPPGHFDEDCLIFWGGQHSFHGLRGVRRHCADLSNEEIDRGHLPRAPWQRVAASGREGCLRTPSPMLFPAPILSCREQPAWPTNDRFRVWGGLRPGQAALGALFRFQDPPRTGPHPIPSPGLEPLADRSAWRFPAPTWQGGTSSFQAGATPGPGHAASGQLSPWMGAWWPLCLVAPFFSPLLGPRRECALWVNRESEGSLKTPSHTGGETEAQEARAR